MKNASSVISSSGLFKGGGYLNELPSLQDSFR